MSTSIYKQILDAVKSTISGLSLTRSDGAAVPVVVRKRAFDGTKWSPGITVAKANIGRGVGTNREDDIGYGVRISIVGTSLQDHLEDLNSFTLWEQRIRNAFSGKRLSGVTEVFMCVYEPAEPLNDRSYAREDRDVSEFIIRCYTRELVRE